MKNKITKICGVGLTLVLATTMLFSAAPVSAGTLSWSAESIPSATGNVLETGSNIVDLDVSNDGTMFAASGSTILWKSTNGGLTWSGITPPSVGDASLVAVAPDDADVVAFADSGNTSTIWISINGGTTWGSLGIPAESGGTAIATSNDIAISPSDAGVNYIAVAGVEASTGDANIWWFDIGAAAPVWKETNDKAGFCLNSLTAFAINDGSAFAVAFSPSFASDKVLTAITANATKVEFQMFSLSTKKWNNAAGYGTSWPITIKNDTAQITDMNAGSIALTPDYLGGDEATRNAFIGASDGTDATLGGIIRAKDTSIKTIKDAESVWSVAFDGTNLVAGSKTDTEIYRTDDPLASTPTFSTASTLKQPGTSGCTNAIVAWRGADVVAGVRGTGSAFAISRDNGKSFNDISLIDTAAATLGALHDVAVSADGSKVFMIAYDANATSLWRKASTWERVLSIAAATGYIVRVAPDDPDAVYMVRTGSTTIYFSNEGGDTKWFTRISRYTIQDLALEGDGDVAYVAVQSTKSVSKTTNAGFTWGSSKSSGIGGNIHTIASLGEDKVIVGSVDGYVGWSTDANSSWSKVSTQLNAAGTTQVTASGLADGDFIYASALTAAGTASRIERWEIGQSGTTWKNLAATFVSTNSTAYGVALVEGVLYFQCVEANADDTEVLRTLSPDTSEPSAGKWATITSADEEFSRTPTSLKVSAGSNKLWAVDSLAPKLYSYTDTLATTGPALAAPGHGADIQINPVSGKSYDVSFTWERPSKANMYHLQIALDYDFDEVVKSITSIASTDSVIAHVVGPGGETTAEFMPGTTYYWRARVYANDPKPYSPWSAKREFTVGELPDVTPVIIQQPPAPIIQVPPAPAITIQPPEIILPQPEIILPAPQVTLPPAPAPVAPIPAWALYIIIIIGAILVIALIVLILRTRRPV